MKKHMLFCPGPVNVAENVKASVAEYEIGHREPEFSVFLKSLNEKLLQLYGPANPEKYQAVFLTGSGTAANEAILSTVVDEGEHILILSNGEFGERLFNISKIHNTHTHQLKFDWAQKIDLAQVEAYLKTHTIAYIAVPHHETSTGMINPIWDIGALCKKYHVKLIIDTVSSLAAEEVQMEKWNVSFASSSSAKAIGSLPGVSTVVASHEDFKNLEHRKQKTMYLHLYKFYEYYHKSLQTPNTPAVQTMIALDTALGNIIEYGVEKRRELHAHRAQLLRDGMRKMGLSFLIDEADASHVLTTVNVSEKVDLPTLRSTLHAEGIIIYNGKGPLEGKVFQVGNIGEITDDAIAHFLVKLELALQKARK